MFKITTKEYCDIVAEMHNQFVKGKPHLRRGQCYYNALYTLRPDLANEICGTKLDPFYVDERIPAFLEWLMEK